MRLIAPQGHADNSRMSPLHTPQILKRILVTLTLGLAFIVMASIFTPDRSRASGEGGAPRTSRGHDRRSGANGSTDAHAGLNSLGMIETGRYAIEIFATDSGPRYTITALDSGDELGTLLTTEQVQMLLPDVDIKSLDFSANKSDSQQLMLADPKD